ncbi:hydroxyisourate hydrolase [Grimontia hollisae]|uniref:5-hydroxyisourate hydrolase n=1 Tax=Grimontia hollisae TaxID=673 RepID=A0A377HPC5_GRIHO|nr:hydroxyisourate hydrolase [Grimontia hollisae]STO57893.1 5-hydroxyisourate hydrolase precursor [Grimontia hollisae]
MKLTAALLTLTTVVSTSALADISVHVLDTNKGMPGRNIEVSLYENVGDNWKLIDKQTTDENGRVKKFDFGESLNYRVVFDVKQFFSSQNVDAFYEQIPVDFKIKNKNEHYHIPLLLSPYAYSTYRGN